MALIEPSHSAGRDRFLRPVLTLTVMLLAWEAACRFFAIQAFILPPPSAVLLRLATDGRLLMADAAVTALEIVLGLGFGAVAGCIFALLLIGSARARRWLQPLLLVSQAMPVFALAPILVVWLGYGIAPKIVMAAAMVQFPVALAFYYGMRHADEGLLDLGRLHRASLLQEIRFIRAPAAAPALAAGLRGAVAIAPLAAVIGEWVGAASGLGFVMVQANARMQTDLMFAAVVLLAVMGIGLWSGVDALLRHWLHWAPESNADSGPPRYPL
jgi:putative hydroxymethylpyrimidine transport system permease protein